MTSELGVDLNIRQKGVRIIKPIIYGNVARYFGHKREDGHTHQWTVYIKPYRNEDMTAYIQKVTFKLHDSYANSLRVVTEPPYEVTETGWGEFDVVIRIYFNDTKDKPIVIVHLMKLFQSEVEILEGTKNLVIENYDELVFDDPSAIQQHLLTTQRPLTLNTYKHETDFEALKVSQLAKLKTTQKRIREEFRLLITQIRTKYFQTIECYRKIVAIKLKHDKEEAQNRRRLGLPSESRLKIEGADEDVDIEGNADEEDVNIVDDVPIPETPREPLSESIVDLKLRYGLDAFIGEQSHKHREYELSLLTEKNPRISFGECLNVSRASINTEDDDSEDSDDDMNEEYYENLEREYILKHGALPAEYVALMAEPLDEETASEDDNADYQSYDEDEDDDMDDDEDDDFFDEDITADISNNSIDDNVDSQNSTINVV